LNTKQQLEDGGWKVLHGIVDSIWVTPNPDTPNSDRDDLQTLAAESTEREQIRLEHEAEYDWVAFVPQRERDAGALTKYFGKIAGEDGFKIRGIETRQRSTPTFVEEIQRECLRKFDDTRSPEAVLGVLRQALRQLNAGDVDQSDLVERNRVSKPLEGYTQYTQNVAALERAQDLDLAVHPGQDIEYIVVDDEKNSRDRVALAHETVENYDASYYETQLIRATESILSPLGWDRNDIHRALAETEDCHLSAFI
jgi:DNA polymerase I